MQCIAVQGLPYVVGHAEVVGKERQKHKLLQERTRQVGRQSKENNTILVY